MSLSSAENLGTSNLVFTYDGAEMSNPVLGTVHNFGTGNYQAMTLTSPATNTVSLNIELITDNAGTALATGTGFTDVAEISFTLPDETGTADFQWQEATTTKTVVYQDDNATLLAKGTLTDNDMSLDATAPSAPGTPDMTTATDSGAQRPMDLDPDTNEDNITNIQQPEFTGTAEAGSTVKLFSGATQIGSATATGGNWSITSSVLAAGAHTITATATDAAGNTSGASSGLSINIETSQPTVVVSTTSTDPTSDNPIPVTITFNEEVEDFNENEITVVNGTTGDFASADSTTFTVNITPSSNGAVQVQVGSAFAPDLAGNSNTASNTLSLTYDGTAPTVTSIVRQTPTDATTNATSAVFRVTFSEDVNNVGIADFAISGAGAGGTAAITGVSEETASTVFDVTVSTINTNGELDLDFSGSQNIADGSGNAFAGAITTEETYTIDQTVPTVTSIVRQTPTDATTNVTSAVFRVTFSEDVNNVGTADFAISGAGAGGTAAITGVSEETASTVFDVTVSTINTNGELDLDFAGGQDIADNGSNAFAGAITTEETYTIDQTAPTLTNQALAQTAADALQVTYQSNETGTLYYVVTTNSSTPTKAQIKAGNDQSGSSTNVVSNGNAAVTVTGADQTLNLTALTLASTTYHVFLYQEDASSNESSVVTNSATVDVTAPTLQSSSPADGATNVTLSQNLTLTFDDNMVVGTGNITIVETGVGNFEQLDVTNGSLVSISTTTVTLNPSGTLKKGTAYHILIDATALDDDAANDFAGISDATILNFSTVDVVINEVVTDPQQDWSTTVFNGTVGAGAVTDGTDEWVELFIKSADIDLSGWTIELNDGTDVTGDLTSSGAFDVSNYTTAGAGTFNNTVSGDFLVLGNVDGSGAMNNTGLTINLKDPGGAIVDAVTIGGGGGEAPSGNATSISDESVQRIPNGTDTDADASDFVIAAASMGAVNDNTAPTFESSTPSTSSVGQTTLTLSTDIDESGTVYYVIVADAATAPTSAEVKAGTASGGGAAVDNGSQAVSTGGFTHDFSVTGLAASTAYDIYVVAEDNNGNLQSAPTLAEESTLTNPTIAFSATSSSGAESVTSANLQVALSAASDQNVTVNFTVVGTATGGGTDYTLADGSITITATNTTNDITIASIVGDDIVEANETVIVTLSGPTNATLGTNTQHTYVINNDDVAGFTIVETASNTATGENGTTDTYTVELDAEPASDVVIDVTSGDIGEGTVDKSSLTFTSANWDTPQTVTVTGVDDDLIDGTQNYNITLSINDGSSNDFFDPVADQTVNVDNTDDDVAGFTVTETAGTTATTEAGTTDTYTVVLDAEPNSNVVIDVASDDTGEITVDQATLTFTTANWDTPQTVTVTGQDDDIIDGTQTSTITMSIDAASTDDNFDGVANETVSADNTDDDVAGFTVTESGGTTATTEAGTTDTYTVVLDAEPNSNVVIDVSSDDTGEVQVDQSSLTFTTANWDTPQTVTVTGQDDDIIDGTQTATITMSVDAASTDDNFDGVANETVSVDNTDDDTAGFTVTESGGTTATTEAGTTDTYTVVLDAEPNSNVVIDVASDDTGEVQVDQATLTFTSANWDTPQTMTVTGQDDALIDGTQTASITMSIDAASTDDNFDGLADQTVSVDNTDDDTPGITVTETAGATTTGENGSTDTYTVELNTEPTSNVVINVTSGDTGEGTVDKATLTFTTANWNTPQTVTVTGVDDNLVDGTQNYDITLSVDDAQSDNDYDPVVDVTLDVNNTDDDVAGFTVSETAGTTTTAESGTTDTYTVVLDAEPNSNVVVDITSDDIGEVTADKTSLTFTTANWNVAQTVTVTGQDDDIIDGTQTATITMSIDAASTDDNFDGVANETVSANNTDDDVAGFTVTESFGDTETAETATTDDFTVVLDAEPNSNVVIDVSSDDTGEVQVDKTSLTFTTANWNVAQTVTVTGQDDDIIDGTQTATVTMSIDAASTDDNFDGVADETVSVDNSDDDVAGFTVTESGGTTATTEAGTTDTYAVVLDAEPNSNVVIDVSSDDTGEVQVDQSSLTFTAANWDTPQTVTVTGQDDALIDGTQTATITMSIDAASTDDNFDGLADQTVSVDNTDNDTPGITVIETVGATTTGENGSTDTYTVVLDAEPGSNVVINVTSGDTGEGIVDQASLTFTTANWNTPQTVTVTGQDDNLVDGTQNYDITMSVDDAQSDNNYDPLADVTVSVGNTDDDVAGFTITESFGDTETNEAGTTDTYTVVLDAEPDSDVVIDVSSDDTGEATIDQASLTFTTANWNVAQTVTVTGQDDDLIDGTQTATITMSIDAAGTDDNFDGVANQTVSVDNTDDDVAGFTVTESFGDTETNESGTTDTYTVVLDAEPNSNVVIDVSSDDTGEAQVDKATLTFTAANWDTPQTVTVTGQDDDLIDGTQTATVTMSIDAASTDDNFDGVANQTVSADNTDDDVAGFTITESASSTDVTEAGGTDSFDVVLDAEPTSNVVIDVTSGDNGEAIVDQSSLTFTSANWDTPQTITVTGQNDDLVDGTQTFDITLSIDAASTDDDFDGLSDQTVSVDNTDDDVAGFTITESASSTDLTEAGGTDSFDVVLDAEPTSNVVIDVTSGDTGEATVDQSSLTFTSANWDTPQTVTVTGVDDDIVDGTQTFDITMSVNDAGSDDDFDGVADQTVSVDNTDDDVAGFTVTESAGSTNTDESGTTDDFTVVLEAQPTSNVVIDVTSGDTSEGTVDQSSLTFTSANWDTPQTVTVTGVDDTDVDLTQTYDITISVNDASSDDVFDALADQTVSVDNTNDDQPTVTLSVDNSTIAENGGTATLTATLSDVFDADIDVTLAYSGTASNGSDYNSSASTVITITAGQLSATAPTIITSIDDADGEGNETIIVDITGVTNGSEDGTQQQTITITDDDAAVVTSVASSTANGNYMAGDLIEIEVNFSQAVNVTGTPQLTLETGTTDQTADYASGDGTTTLTFNYTVQAGDVSADLDYVDANSLTLNGGSIIGNSLNAILDLPAPGATNSLGDNAAIIVDTSSPVDPVVTTPTGDILVNAASQTIGGTHGEDGVTIHAYADSNNDGVADNTTSLGSATVSSNAWSFSVNLTGDAANNFVVQAMDAAGNTSAQVDVPTITEDSTSPVITSDGGAATASLNVNENSTAVTTVTATDDNAVTYTISGGADQALFSMTSGVLTFTTAPDFENPTDANTDNAYVVEVTASDGVNTDDTQTITVTVTDQDDNSPVITSDGGGATAAVNVNENSTAVATVTATDADGVSTVTYSISGGADQALFSMASGVLTFTNAPDFENPTDANTDNAYVVEVSASDGSTTADTQTITVMVADLNDNNPVITASQTLSVDETASNSTSVGTVVATDQDAGTTFSSWAITAGNGAGIFAVNAATGEVTIADNTNLSPKDVTASYTLTLTVSDGTNTSAAETVTVNILDTTAPVAPVVVSISDDTGSDTSDEITNDNTLNFIGTAVANSTVELFVDGTSIGTTTSDGAGDFTFDHTGTSLSDGVKAITAKTSDASGNQSVASAALSITVDTTPPAKPVLTSISDDTGISSSDAITSDDLLIFSGTAEPFSVVSLEAQNFVFITAVADANGDWVADFTNRSLALGVTVTSTSVDVAGNVSPVSDPLVVVIDKVAPEVTAITRDDASPTAASSVDYTVSFDEEVHGLSASNFGLVFTGTQNAGIGSVSATSGTSVTVTVNNITGEGTFGLNLTSVTGITDVAGNTLAGTFTGELYTTNSTPTDIGLSSTSILENNTIGDAVGTLSSTDVDAGDTHTYTLVAGTGDTDNASFSINGTQLEAAAVFDLETKGSYSIRVQTDDGSGGTFQKTFTITIDNVNDNNPVITVGQTLSVDETASNSTSLGTVVATDADAGTTFSSWAITAGNGAGIFAINATTGEVTIADNTNLSPRDVIASYTLTLTVNDGMNTSATETVAINILDTTAPAAPVVVSISDDNGSNTSDGITNDNTLQFSGTAEANSMVEVFIDGSSIGTTTADGSGDWTYDHTATALADAAYSITARATDGSGNTGALSAAYSLTIDTALPQKVGIGSISDDTGISSTDGITNDDLLIFYGTAEPFSVVSLEALNFVFVTAVADANGDWVADFTNRSLALGVTVTSTSVDIAGNVSPVSDPFVVVIDKIAPEVTAITRDDASPTMATSVDYTVTFDEEVHGLSASNFGLVFTGTQNASIASVSATSGTSVTVTVNNVTGEGTFGLNLTSVTGITDVAGNTLAGAFTGELYTTNSTPTDIGLSSTSILENNTIGDAVGTLSSTDVDTGDTHTYTLVAGTGDTDNASFSINGTQLEAAAVFDLETKGSYSIRIQTDDGSGGVFQKAFTITIDNVPEADLRITGNNDIPATPLGITTNFDITVHNDGDAAMTVSSILYPNAFGGPVTGINIPAASSQVITMSFTPTVAQLYTGDITIVTNGGTGILSVSADGAIITGTDDGILSADAINIYPNPASDVVTVDLSEFSGRPLDIQLFDISGNKAFSVTDFKEATLKLDIRTYQQGIYLMYFTDGKSTVQKKFMIRK